MSSTRVRCMFCFMDSLDSIEASREHLLSKPVAEAFGIERDSPFLLLDEQTQSMDWRRLSGVQYKLVCNRCNSGWMNQLEHAMKDIATWLSDTTREAIGEHRERNLRWWALKTHVLLCFLAGDASHWTEDGWDHAVVPPASLSRALYEGDADVVHEAGVALALCHAPVDFAYAFGYPTIKGHRGTGSLCPVSVVTLGSLQLWVVAPVTSADVFVPTDVIALSPSTTVAQLHDRDHPLNVRDVIVDFN